MTNQSSDIAVLGGGISGLLCAYSLVQKGCRVTIYDPAGFPARNASFMAGGMLAPYSEIEHMDLRWVQAGLDSIEIWRKIDGALEQNIEFSQQGSLLIAHEQDRYILDRFRDHLEQAGGEDAVIGTLEPALSSSFQTGLFLFEEAHLHPQKTMQALCEFLSERAELISQAQDIDALRGQYDIVIDARGMMAEHEAPNLRGVKGETAIVRNSEFTLSRPVRIMHPRYPLYVVPRDDHMFMIGATVIESEDETGAVSVKSSLELMSALYSLHPSFADAQLIEFNAGIRPSYADNLPRIRRDDSVISVNGMFRHGYLFAPVMAEAVQALIAEQDHPYGDVFIRGYDENYTQRKRQNT